MLRFIGMLLIMGHHLYHIGMEGMYLTRNCWVWVDFYFILSGAFTYAHFSEKSKKINEQGSEALAYTLSKFKKFVFPTICAVFLEYCLKYSNLVVNLQFKELLKRMIYLPYEIMFLSSSGITSPVVAPIWYLSAMFIVLPLIVYLMQEHREAWKIIAFMSPILYFGYKGVNTDRAWPNDMVRAFACLALGTIAYLLGEKINHLRERFILKILLSVLEMMSVMAAIYISVFNREWMNLMELLFFSICIFMLSGKTISATLNVRMFYILGSLSMPMYIFHWTVGTFAGMITENITKRILIYYVGTFLVSIIVLLFSKRKEKFMGFFSINSKMFL